VISSSLVDPLEAADQLAGEISGSNDLPGDISRLIRALDTLAYAIHFTGPENPDGKAGESDSPRLDYRQVYDAVKERYPPLGCYWVALHPVMQDGVEGEVAVADAIDDLADILIELSDVRRIRDGGGRKDALAALRARYDMHLWMHVHSLRQYLEEVNRDD